jgi:hypothetical protein
MLLWRFPPESEHALEPRADGTGEKVVLTRFELERWAASKGDRPGEKNPYFGSPLLGPWGDHVAHGQFAIFGKRLTRQRYPIGVAKMNFGVRLSNTEFTL